ncbi:MAG: hypothetical protein ACFBSG_07455 [Leptolyngbyaceae cyanobacterium]
MLNQFIQIICIPIRNIGVDATGCLMDGVIAAGNGSLRYLTPLTLGLDDLRPMMRDRLVGKGLGKTPGIGAIVLRLWYRHQCASGWLLRHG